MKLIGISIAATPFMFLGKNVNIYSYNITIAIQVTKRIRVIITK